MHAFRASGASPERSRASQQRRQRDARLESCERLADTEVDPVTERVMACLFTIETERVRVWMYGCIAVGRSEHRDHTLPFANPLVVKIDIGRRFAHQELHRRVVSQR